MRFDSREGLCYFAIGLMIVSGMIGIMSFCSGEVRASKTWVVDNTGGGDFTTIKAALNCPSLAAGDSIQVNYGSGTYNENNPLIITISLFIIGIPNEYDQLPTVSATNGNYNVFSINSGYPTMIEQLTITGATSSGCSGVQSQVSATSSNPVTLQFCILTGNYFGVKFTSASSYNIVDDCMIYDNSDNGVNLDGSNHLVEYCGSGHQENTGIFQNGGCGIYGESLTDTTVTDSNIWNNDEQGILFTSSSNSNTIEDTEIWDNGLKGLDISGNGNTIDGLGTRKIKNNNADGSGTMYDVYIGGNDNVITDYQVLQDPSVGTDINGIYTSNTNSNYPNQVQDCEVSGYQGEDSCGVLLDDDDEILGIDTEVSECNIGAIVGDCIVDCDNTAFSSGSENFYNNVIGISVVGDDCVIREAYIYVTGSPTENVVGIEINNTNDGSAATVEDCKIEKQGKGIEILESDNIRYSTIDDVDFVACLYAGIYIYDGAYDDISYCDFTTSDAGIFLEDSENIDITYCSFVDNYIGTGTGASTKDVGIYGKNADIISVQNCDFDGNEKGVLLDDTSTTNEILYCDFTDDNNRFNDTDREANCWEIGIYIKGPLSNSNLISECDFDKLDNAIAIKGSLYIDIFGSTSTNSTMSNILDYGLIAIDDGTYPSGGRIRNYQTSIKVYLEGVDGGSSTNFTYKDLGGSPSCTGDDGYNWDPE